MAQKWKGYAIRVLFTSIMFYALAFAYATNEQFNLFLRNDGKEIIAQLPSMTIKDGTFFIKEKQPHYIYGKDYRDGRFKRAIVIIDNTGAWKESTIYGNQALITSSSLLYKELTGVTWSVPFRLLPDMTIDGATLSRAIEWFQSYMPVIIYPIVVGILFILWLIKALIYSVIGLFLNKILYSFMSYQQILRITIIALIPVLTLNGLYMVWRADYPDWPWIGFLLAMGYIAFGLRANRELLR